MNSHQSIPDLTLALSYKMMNEWEDMQNFDLILAAQRREDNSEVTDMAAALCRNTFRKRALIDWLIDKISDKRPRGRIYKLLRLAVCQILEDDLNKAVVCDTAVRFCRRKYNKFEANFVNQFMRKLTSAELPEASESIRLCLSPELNRQWSKHFSKDQISEWAGILMETPALTARRSQSRPDISDLEGCMEPVELPEWAGAFEFFEITNAKKFLKENDGRLYIQDPATVCSISMLSPKPGEAVADLCAAPGGKSRMIAEILGKSGLLYSCDVSKKRLLTVEENLRAFENVKIVQNDALKPSLNMKFDGILLDVPCSNTGVIRRKADVRWSFSSAKLKELNELQFNILKSSAALIKPGGRIIYSTCSIDPEENEAVVERFLKESSSASLAESRTVFPSKKHDGSHASKIIFE